MTKETMLLPYFSTSKLQLYADDILPSQKGPVLQQDINSFWMASSSLVGKCYEKMFYAHFQTVLPYLSLLGCWKYPNQIGLNSRLLEIDHPYLL